MWNIKLDNGKYKFVERYYDATGKTKYVTTQMPTDSVQSENKARKILNQKIAKKKAITQTFESITFEELAKQWINLKKKMLKPSTIKSYESVFSQLNKYFGDVEIEKLTAGKINHAFLDMYSNGLSYKTVQERYKLIRAMMKFAVEYELIDDDHISHKLKLEKINLPDDTEDKYLEPEEAESIFERMIEDDEVELADFFKLQMQTGMRYSELAALHVDDIDLDKQTIYIQYTYDNRNKIFTLPKNNKARLIDINVNTVKLIKGILYRRKLLMMAYGVRKNELLFFRRNGEPLEIAVSNRILHKYESKDKELTSHIFRHTFITRMVENNVPAKLIAEHVGHTGTEMVERVYSHFSDKMKNDLKQAVNDVMI